jgi:hypothetical protein
MKNICISERWMWSLLVVGAIAGALMVGWQTMSEWEVLPQAEKQGVLSKLEAEDIATTFVQRHFNLDTDSYNVVSILTFTPLPDVFLTRSFLSPEEQKAYYDAYLSSTNIYSIRFYKIEQIEEYTVSIDAFRGDIVSFSQVLPKDAVLHEYSYEDSAPIEAFAEEIDIMPIMPEESNFVEPSVEEAVATAQAFVSEITGAPTSLLSLHGKDEVTLPGGVERKITLAWQGTEVDSEFGKGFVTFETTVRGNLVSSFNPSYEYPESYERSLEKSTTLGSLVGFGSLLAWLFIIIGSLVVMIKAFSAHNAKWKLSLGVTIFLAALGVLDFVNQYPELMMWYSTVDSTTVYWIFSILIAIVVTLVTSLMLFFPSVAGQTLASEKYQNRIAPLLTLPISLESKTAYRLALARGYLLGIFFLGFTFALYWIGEEYLGVWYPHGADNIMIGIGGFIPAFSMMVTIGFMAAITEEVTFRLFGILWLSKITKSTLVGVIVATFVWAFAHTDGSVLPVWFRGAEVLIGGLLFACFFIRYNILTTIVAHYVHNIIIAGIILWFTFGNNEWLSIILIFAAPALMYLCFEIFVNYKRKA